MADAPRTISRSASIAVAELANAPGRAPSSAVDRARSGDQAAFELLVELHLPRAYRTAMAILGSEHDARDAVQDAFLKAWRELPRLREADRFDAWLTRILVNTCRTALRGRGRRSLREIPIPVDGGAELDDRGPRHEDRVGDLEELEAAFSRLGVEERTLLALHYLEHRQLAEIGAVLGVPEGTVKSRLHAARRSLERALEAGHR